MWLKVNVDGGAARRSYAMEIAGKRRSKPIETARRRDKFTSRRMRYKSLPQFHLVSEKNYGQTGKYCPFRHFLLRGIRQDLPLLGLAHVGLRVSDLAKTHSGRLGGAGLDVVTVEPPTSSNPLIGVRDCIITPTSPGQPANHGPDFSIPRFRISGCGSAGTWKT